MNVNNKSAAHNMSVKNWEHLPSKDINDFANFLIKDRSKFDQPEVYAEAFSKYFYSARDGRTWIYTGLRFSAMDKADAMRSATNLIRQCGGKASEMKAKAILFLIDQFAKEIPPVANGINVMNGFLEFTGTGWNLVPHSAGHGQRLVLPCDFDINHKAPVVWQQFLDRVQPHADVQSYLQEFIGYVLLGRNRPMQECFAVWAGEGANGKSTALRVIENLMGAENCSYLSMHELTGRNIEDLEGKLVNLGSEIEGRSKTQTSTLKKMVSGEAVRAEPKYRDHRSLVSEAVPVFAVNSIPALDDTSDGIWRRMHLLTWDVSIPSDEQDKALADKLLIELAGVLQWAIAGAERVLQNGLKVPQKIRDAVKLQRMEANSVAMLCKEVVVEQVGASISKEDLYRAYIAWCKRSGFRPLSVICFAKELKRVYPHLSESKTPVGYINFDGRVLQARVNAWSGILIPAEKLHRYVANNDRVISGEIGAVSPGNASNDAQLDLAA